MADYIIKPSADAVTDFSNAEEFTSVSESDIITLAQANQDTNVDVYVLVASSQTVTGS